MAHREEEKRRRREERLAREAAEKRAAARKQRLRMVLGGIALVAVVAVAGVALAGSLGGGEGDPQEASTNASVSIPAPRITDLQEAAEAASCRLTNPPIEGATHETRDFRASDYETNPPTSGNHNAEWYEDGVYDPGTLPRLGMIVHTLEHGRINVQYAPGTPDRTVAQLETLVDELDSGYHMLLYENTTDMDAQVAATAWGHSLTCAEMNPRVFDAIRAFRARYIDQGPEQVP